MSHKKPKNRALKNQQSKDEIAKLKNQAGLKDPACILDHEHLNCNYDNTEQNEPFSFSSSGNLNSQKIQQKKAGKSSSKKEFINDVTKSLDNNLNLSGNMFNNSLETSKAATNLLQELLLNTSSYLSNSLKQNVEVSKDFLQCKDSNDLVNFQNNLFKTNFANMLDYSVKVSNLMQNFATTHANIFSDLLNVNSKIIHNED